MQILKLCSSPEGGSISPFKTKDRISPDLQVHILKTTRSPQSWVFLPIQIHTASRTGTRPCDNQLISPESRHTVGDHNHDI